MSVNSQLLRKIPKVDELLRLPELSELSCLHTILTESVRETIDRVRQQILSGEQPSLEAEQLCRQVLALVHKKTTMSLRPVINATGIVLHTNLGRARLSDAAVEAIHSVAQDYNTLEYNLEKGSRGSRYSHVEKLIAKLTGTEAAMVVNNNAAAVMLVLSTMTKGKEVITSRGELVEIGGAFRVPEIMQQSGGTLVEVGTTNKTHLSDYQNAITENTGALLKVHTSNFKIMGFCEEVSLEEMVELGLSTTSRSSTTLAPARWSACPTTVSRMSQTFWIRSNPALTSSASPATSCWAVHRQASSSDAANTSRQ